MVSSVARLIHDGKQMKRIMAVVALALSASSLAGAAWAQDGSKASEFCEEAGELARDAPANMGEFLREQARIVHTAPDAQTAQELACGQCLQFMTTGKAGS
jgi:hypothetical protein